MVQIQRLIAEQEEVLTSESNIIHILSFENRQIKGFFYSPYFKKGAYFSSELELIQLMDQWMDYLDFPQSTVRFRSFAKRKKNNQKREESSVEHEPQNHCGILKTIEDWDTQKAADNNATFIVRVQQRQNATWQGTVQWAQAGQTQSFQSTLELLMMMNSACEKSPNSLWDTEKT
ncbi:hypothetical protein [Clostridium minihomine]|uniref:hypothetical protein n=1 Tax=Clostridium minihomine TaxID=2045012 RepID=UPI000C764802|nr:hypothetical protein [Clostridium minihomine]